MQSRRGRPRHYTGQKKDKRLTITEEGWTGATEAIKAAGFSSVSQFLEELGRGNAAISRDKIE